MTFVAFSEIAVPQAGRDRLIKAFDGRLREVDQWPGFHRFRVVSS
jgi:heme-degrading monooxygenase HmoA